MTTERRNPAATLDAPHATGEGAAASRGGSAPEGVGPSPQSDRPGEGEAALTPDLHRPSHELIYESIMRGGGEPFGRPFDVGVATLTERIVRYFKQKGFFGFETLDRVLTKAAQGRARARARRNKFTRYGAAQFRGELSPPAEEYSASDTPRRDGRPGGKHRA